MQSVFSAASRRTISTERLLKAARDGALKTDWTKPWHGGGQLWGSNGAGDGELGLSSGAKRGALRRE